MKRQQSSALSENEWKIFQHVKPGKRFEIVFTTNQHAEFYPSLRAVDAEVGYDLDCFMDVDITGSKTSRYAVYLRCVNFIRFFAHVVYGMTEYHLDFVAAYDREGYNIGLIEIDITEPDSDETLDDDEFSQEELAKLYRLVYVISAP